MVQRGGLFSGLKDGAQRNRNMILYLLLLAALFGAMGGWLSLPDQVTMLGVTEGVEPAPGFWRWDHPAYRWPRRGRTRGWE